MPHPLLLEINTRCWLAELSSNHGRPVTLANVPEGVFSDWLRSGFTHVWLMGVWTTGPRSRQQALSHESLRREFDLALPGWREEDVPGSPYAIASYEAPPALGGDAGLEVFRRQLHQHGLALLLDFVPNHVGLDHPWIEAHPERFVQSAAEHPLSFHRNTRQGGRWIVHGKDPHFDPWDDTAQLDFRRMDVQDAMTGELRRVAGKCDGVRCDMAMLLLHEGFDRTWKEFPISGMESRRADTEFWEVAISRIKLEHPGFLFLAEAYWNLEGRLQELGFDFTYDKRITDALLQRRPRELTRLVETEPAELTSRSAHFLENHDEVRVASVLSPAEHRAAALAVLALPGMRLVHDGQMRGARVRTPVQLGVRLGEPADPGVEDCYAQLFRALKSARVGQGPGEILHPQPAWAGNPTSGNILAIVWGGPETGYAWAVVNLAGHRSQCYVPWNAMPSGVGNWHLTDLLGPERWLRPSNELRQPGLYLDVAPYATHIFQLDSDAEPLRASASPRG